MEDLGFLEHFYEHLPENFTAVFEIARILEDSSHWLTKHLEPALSLQAPSAQTPHKTGEPDPRVIFQDFEELEAGLIRTYADLPHIYHQQWLLPEEAFTRKLGRKE